MQDPSPEPLADDANGPRFPPVVLVAGIAWIVFGGLILLNLVFVVLAVLVAAGAQGGAQQGAFLAGGLCVAVVIGLFGAAFLFVGIQTVRGTARDTLGSAIGSLVIGALNLLAGGGAVMTGNIQGVINLLAGAGLVTAGVLALVGRSEYRAWRQTYEAR